MLDWGEVRSACHQRDWQALWQAFNESRLTEDQYAYVLQHLFRTEAGDWAGSLSQAHLKEKKGLFTNLMIFPKFELISQPTLSLTEIRNRRFDLVERAASLRESQDNGSEN
jgi:hypothetical protein